MRSAINQSVVKVSIAAVAFAAPLLLGSVSILPQSSSASAQSLASSLSKPSVSTIAADKSAYRIQVLNAAIEKNPNDANLYNSRGWYHFQQGAYAESIADYTRVETLGVETIDEFYQPTVYYVRGLSYAQLSENEAAIADLEVALEMYEERNEAQAVEEISTILEQLRALSE